MTSARKLQANQSNARRSTGPKTVGGKRRASQNSRRHGLSSSVMADPERSDDVEALVHTIVGDSANAEAQQLARDIAEAQIDLVRVRRARHELFVRNLDNPNFQSRADSHERLRMSLRIFCQIDAGRPIAPDLIKALDPKLEGPEQFTAILSDLAKKLSALERYERRALSRRKFAVRAFDAAQHYERLATERPH